MRIEREARQPAGLDGAAQERVVQIEAGGQVGGEERDADRVRAGLDREAEIDRQLARSAAGSSHPQRLVPIDQRDPLAVEEDLELLPAHLSEGPGVAHVAHVHRHHPEGVLAVGGKQMPHVESAARSERQPVDVVVLRRILRDAIDGLGRRRDVADGQPGDAGRRRQVGLEQRRRQAQRSGLVVESTARIVRGQKLRGVHLDREQIAHDVGVLAAVRAMEPGRRQAANRVAVQLGLEPPGQRGVDLGNRTRRAGRRHQAGPQPPHAPFQDLGVIGDAGQIDSVPHDTGVPAHCGLPVVAATGCPST